MKRFRLVPTRGVSQRSLHVWGTETSATQAAHELFRETGVPILVCSAPLDGIVTVVAFVGVKKRWRSSKRAVTLPPLGDAPAPAYTPPLAGAEILAREPEKGIDVVDASSEKRVPAPGGLAGAINQTQGER